MKLLIKQFSKMISSKAFIATAALAIFLFVTIAEAGIMVAIKTQEIDVPVTLCHSDDSRGECKEQNIVKMPVKVSFACKNIEAYNGTEDWTKNQTLVKLNSSPIFGSCIMVYNESDCNGDSHKVEGNGDYINLKSLSMNFNIVKSLALCYNPNSIQEGIRSQNPILPSANSSNNGCGNNVTINEKQAINVTLCRTTRGKLKCRHEFFKSRSDTSCKVLEMINPTSNGFWWNKKTTSVQMHTAPKVDRCLTFYYEPACVGPATKVYVNEGETAHLGAQNTCFSEIKSYGLCKCSES